MNETFTQGERPMWRALALPPPLRAATGQDGLALYSSMARMTSLAVWQVSRKTMFAA